MKFFKKKLDKLEKSEGFEITKFPELPNGLRLDFVYYKDSYFVGVHIDKDFIAEFRWDGASCGFTYENAYLRHSIYESKKQDN